MERTYRRSTRFSTYTHFEKDELEDIIDEIKKTGVIPKGKYISPPQIEPFLKDLYFRLQDMYEDVRNGNVDDSTKRQFDMTFDQMKADFINLSQPIQLPLIKKFQIGNSFRELQHTVIIKIMEILNNNTYNKDKAAITSWIYENIYWVLLKNFKDEKEYEQKMLTLIDFEG